MKTSSARIRIGTRGSALALWQAEHVAASIRAVPGAPDPELILIKTEGVYGARFSGAGFRGCCVALVQQEAGPNAADHVRREYAQRYPDLAHNATTILCHSDDGARIL